MRRKSGMLWTQVFRHACATACRVSGARRMNIWKDFKGETGARSALLAAADEVNGGGSKMAEQGGTTVLPNQKLRAELPGPNHGEGNDAVEGAYPADESMEAFIKAQQEWNSVADTNAQLLSSDGLHHHSAEDEAGQDKGHAAGGCCHRGVDELGRERVFAEGMLLVDRLEESGSVSPAEANNLRKMCTLMDGRVLVVLLAYRGSSPTVTSVRLRQLLEG